MKKKLSYNKIQLPFKSSWREVVLLSATFLCSALLTVSCKKKDNALGASQLKDGLGINGFGIDTFQLVTSSELDDTVVTKNPVLSVLGSYHDPVFGRVDAQIYTQVRLTASNPNFGNLNDIFVDSMVLALKYSGFTGKSGFQTFEVYELADSISTTEPYYSNSTVNLIPNNRIDPNASSVKMDANANVIIDTVSSVPQLRLKLDTALAKTWMAEANSSSGNFSSADNFVKYFKGICIRTNNPAQSSGQGGIGYFGLTENASGLTIYYRQKNNSGIYEKKQYALRINSSAQRFNRVTIDRNGTRPQQVLDMPALGQQEFYAQAFGLRGKIAFPSVSNIPKNSIVNRAELFIPVQYQLASAYNLGSEITVAANLTSAGLSLLNLGVYSDFRKGFVIDLRAYIQQIVAGNVENLPLLVAPRQFISSADRIIFNGPATTNKLKPTLSIIYTEF